MTLLVMAGLVIFLLALLGALDALSTNILGRPVPAVFELTEVGIALVVFLAQPYVVYRSAHISVELFEVSNPLLRQLRRLVVLGLSLLSYAIISVGLWRSMIKSIDISEMSIGLVYFPIWPFKVAVFGCVMATMFILVCMVLPRTPRASERLAVKEVP